MGLDELKKIQEDLKRKEEIKHGAGGPRATKAMLLDASEVQEAHPDKRVRWVQTGVPERAMSRLADGYEIVPESEGGRRVGGLQMGWTSKENYDARVKDIERRNKERLESHKAELQQTVQAIVRELRDKHGVQIDERRLYVDE